MIHFTCVLDRRNNGVCGSIHVPVPTRRGERVRPGVRRSRPPIGAGGAKGPDKGLRASLC